MLPKNYNKSQNIARGLDLSQARKTRADRELLAGNARCLNLNLLVAVFIPFLESNLVLHVLSNFV